MRVEDMSLSQFTELIIAEYVPDFVDVRPFTPDEWAVTKQYGRVAAHKVMVTFNNRNAALLVVCSDGTMDVFTSSLEAFGQDWTGVPADQIIHYLRKSIYEIWKRHYGVKRGD